MRETAAPVRAARAAASRLRQPALKLARAVSVRPFAREACWFALFAALTVVMTWPWARNWRDTVTDLGDPYTIAYTLWWDYHATFNQPARLFDATIFYPYRDTLAFSEHDYGISLLFFPLFAAGVAPLTVHSLATMLAFALSGYGAFRLARTLTGSSAAGLVAGIFFAFVPYRFHRLPHLHYVFAGWLPLVFEAAVLFARGRTWRRAAWLGAAFAMNGLTCLTWFVLSLIPLAATGALAVAWGRAWRDRRLWVRGGLALALASLLLLPFLLPYRRVAAEHGFTRTAAEVAGYSATLAHWFSVSDRNRLWWPLGRAVVSDELTLFPGLVAPLLALASLLFFAARRDGDSQKSRRLTVALALLDAGAVVSVFGALTAATRGEFGVELFGIKLLRVTQYGGALVVAALLLALRWVLSRTELFRLLRERGPSAFARPGAQGQGVVLALAWAAPGFAGSFGLNFFFHRLLFEHLEPFRNIRVPARWAMIAYVGLAVLAAIGARQLAELLSRRDARLRPSLVCAALAAMLVAELWAAPLAVMRGQARPDALTVKLGETPMRGGVVHLPVFGAGGQTLEHMIRAADHRKPLVTASSSYHPPLVNRIHALSQQRPMTAELLDLLESVPASYLVIDYSQMTLEEIDAVRPLIRHALDSDRLRFRGRFEDRGTKDLFAVARVEPGAAGLAGYAPPRVRLKVGERGGAGSVVGLSLTPEIEEGGALLYRFYKATHGRAPTFAEFQSDLPALVEGVEVGAEGWRERLAAGAEAFAARWVERDAFRKLYDPLDARAYVDGIAENAGPGLFDGARREQLASELAGGSETRAGALLRVVGDEGFARRESDAAFVTLHYFSFLERDPDPEGFGAWLKALGRVSREEFTRAFTASVEYQNKRNAPK